MGNILYVQDDASEDSDLHYRLNTKEAAALKNIWKTVDENISQYSSAFSTILFTRHPQYRKFFEEELIPQFIQESKVRKKFFSVCTIISALFAHYYNQRFRREYFLGYIGMIHKDMGLSHTDLDNFTTALLDTLLEELPNEMTAECIIIQSKCLKSLTASLVILMKEQREYMEQIMGTSDLPKNICRKICECKIKSMYGRPINYWLTRKKYWEQRMSMWLVVDIETTSFKSEWVPMDERQSSDSDPVSRKFDAHEDRTSSSSSTLIPRPSKTREAFLEAVRSLRSIAREDSHLHKVPDHENRAAKREKEKPSDKKKVEKDKHTKTVDATTPRSKL